MYSVRDRQRKSQPVPSEAAERWRGLEKHEHFVAAAPTSGCLALEHHLRLSCGQSQKTQARVFGPKTRAWPWVIGTHGGLLPARSPDKLLPIRRRN